MGTYVSGQLPTGRKCFATIIAGRGSSQYYENDHELQGDPLGRNSSGHLSVWTGPIASVGGMGSIGLFGTVKIGIPEYVSYCGDIRLSDASKVSLKSNIKCGGISSVRDIPKHSI
ncbi:hypothetical protein CEXT_672311 [Caerostris extrusa]|uniref:Uncharacterized protein n=1 Tax=Caerostris extrusa TaxID=172846 RepID=A0AAV4Q6V8_CAEEX|nr:hypothetical protein CEXT_672311 [Caerostris extrusa]